MFKKIRENSYMKKIKNELNKIFDTYTNVSVCAMAWVNINSIKSEMAYMIIQDKISLKFYQEMLKIIDEAKQKYDEAIKGF